MHNLRAYVANKVDGTFSDEEKDEKGEFSRPRLHPKST